MSANGSQTDHDVPTKTIDSAITAPKSKIHKNIATALYIINGNQKIFNFDVSIFGQIKDLIVNTDSVFLNKESNDQSNKKKSIAKQNTEPKYYKTVLLNKDELKQERMKKSQLLCYRNCKYKCRTCIIGFNFEENLHDHTKRKHSEISGCVKCNICDQYLPARSIKEHYKRHYTRYECADCCQRYMNRIDVLAHHRRKHENKKYLTNIKTGSYD